MRFLLFIACVSLATVPLFVAVDAQACNDDFQEHYVVGVAADGGFVTLWRSWAGGSGRDPTSINIHDYEDLVVTTIEYYEDDYGSNDCYDLTPAEREACQASPTYAHITGAPLPVALDDKAKVVVARLKKKLGLTAPKAGSTRLALGNLDPDSDGLCPLVAKTPDGPLTVASAGGY